MPVTRFKSDDNSLCKSPEVYEKLTSLPECNAEETAISTVATNNNRYTHNHSNRNLRYSLFDFGCFSNGSGPKAFCHGVHL